jgi:hypothetical protein
MPLTSPQTNSFPADSAGRSRSNDTRPPTPSFRHRATCRARAHDHFANPHTTTSQRQYARDSGIPRSTLGRWCRRSLADPSEPELSSFLASSAGHRFLRRLILALFIVCHLQGGCGVRLLSLFLVLTRLDRFVAPSPSALHVFGQRLERLLATFADEERQLLSQGLIARLIALIADENFHGPANCLVAIEPVSNFILVEEYQQNRVATTWAEAIRRGLHGLALQVALLTSDQAKGIMCCAGSHLGARHLPELFHGLRDLGRPLFGPLQRQIKAARKKLDEAKAQTQYWRDEQHKAQSGPPRPGRPLQFDWRIALSATLEKQAAGQLQACEQRKEQVKQTLRGLTDDYHPCDAHTGQPVTAEQMEERLNQRVQVLEQVTVEAGLGVAAREALLKGRNWLVVLVATLGWFWSLARQRVGALQLSAEAERQVLEQLLPGLYWQALARRGRTAEQRQERAALGEKLLRQAWARGGALACLGEEEKKEVQRVTQEVVGLFQPSSSCVEGRNGRLALLHHGHTRLSAGKLKAATVIHNYVVEREDGSTAAERLFGKKQRNAFAWLLEHMPDLPRPAAPRPKRVPTSATDSG